MEIKVGEFYKTRNGDKAGVVYEFKNHEAGYKFIAVENKPDTQREITVTEDGHYFHDGEEDGSDLVAQCPKNVKVEGWLNVYPTYLIAYNDKEEADSCASKKRIACVKIDMEVEEGEGL